MAERNQPQERLKFAQDLNQRLLDGSLRTIFRDSDIPDELRVSLRGHLIQLLNDLQTPRSSGPDYGIQGSSRRRR